MPSKSDPSRSGQSVPAGDGVFPDRVVQDLARTFGGLADPHRLHILFLLARHGELNVGRITEAIGMTQPGVSHHLIELRRAGLVEYRKEGKYHLYRLAPDGLNSLIADLFPDGVEPRLCFGAIDVTFRKG